MASGEETRGLLLRERSSAAATRFLRTGALAAVLSGVTTFLLWWLPRMVSPAASFEEALLLASDPFYLTRLWVNLAHVFIALAGYGAAAAIIARQRPELAWIGVFAMAFWCLSEALGVSINIWAQNGDWRSGFAEADAQTRLLIKAAIFTYQGLWNGIFFIVLVTFAAGSLALGLGMPRDTMMGWALSVLLLAAVPLTLIIMLDGYFGFQFSGWIEWSYPILQPFSRTLMGIWIWRQSVPEAGLRIGRD